MPWRADRRLFGVGLRLANQLIAPIDRLARSNSGNPIGPLFVVGLPRSGTTLAYELIVQAFDVAFFTRAYSYTFGLPSVTTRLMQRFAQAPVARYESSYGRIPGLFSPAENHVLWERWFRPSRELGHYVPPGVLEKKDIASAKDMLASITAIAGRPYVFKDVYLAMSPRALLEVFPDSRIIVVERDFDAVCASVYRSRIRMKRGTWWSIRPPFYEPMLDKDEVEKTAFQCVRVKQLMQREYGRVPASRCFKMSYEDLCDSPTATLRRLEDWAAPTLKRRTHADIPSSFERVKLQGMPENVVDRFARVCDAMSGNREAYLRKVDLEARQLGEVAVA